MRALNGHIESAPCALRAREPVENQPIRVRRQPRVGMEKEQDIAARNRGARIHLRGSPARAVDDKMSERLCERDSPIRAAAIDHDDFRAARAQRYERLEGGDNVPSFVEYRDND